MRRNADGVLLTCTRSSAGGERAAFTPPQVQVRACRARRCTSERVAGPDKDRGAKECGCGCMGTMFAPKSKHASRAAADCPQPPPSVCVMQQTVAVSLSHETSRRRQGKTCSQPPTSVRVVAYIWVLQHYAMLPLILHKDHIGGPAHSPRTHACHGSISRCNQPSVSKTGFCGDEPDERVRRGIGIE